MSFKAILYKNWRTSLRHYIHSLFQILLPVLPFVLFVTTSNNVSSSSDVHNYLTIQSPPKDTKEQIIQIPGTLDIRYTPNNSFTNKLMANATGKLPGVLSCIAMETEKDIENWFHHANYSFMAHPYGIVFDLSKEDNVPPHHLNYTIRGLISQSSSSAPSTKLLFPITYGLSDAEIYINSKFLALQTVINDAFLDEIGLTEGKQWTIQPFPSPSSKSGGGVNIEVYLIPILFSVMYLYVFTSLSTFYITEKTSGIAERLKMVGLGNVMIVLNYLTYSLIKCIISTVILSILLKTFSGIGGTEKSNIVIVWLALIIFCIQAISFFLAISAFFNNSALALSFSSVFYFLPFFALKMSSKLEHVPVIGQVFTSMFPILSIFWSFQNVYGFEYSGQGATFSNLIKIPPSGYCHLPMIVIMIVSLLASLLFLFIFWYVNSIKPGPYGYAKPWHFIFPNECTGLFKGMSSNILKIGSESDFDAGSKGLYERIPDNVEVGLKISNLHKTFGKLVSVKNLSMDVYVDQITVLLGHNGAGKTTTMSIISGMFKPTSGSIQYRGYNIFNNLKAFRYDLGLCPQEDMLMNDLSPWEHLLIFGMIKGLPMKELVKSANEALDSMGILGKKDVVVQNLSGGMKRKLCLALALVGSPKVMILDEPTSGLDPESRREIWNILLRLRSKRIMIVTTHFMEEADVLGDQIAIMDHGEIKCYGTPLFLKKHYGAGYQMTICSSEVSKFDDIIQFVKSQVDASIVNKTQEQVVLNIPSNRSGDFPNLLKALESNEEFQITRIGVTCTTMDDVFLKVREEADANVTPNISSRNNLSDVPGSFNELKSRSLIGGFIQRLFSLFVKNMLYTKSRWFSSFIMVILYPSLTAYWAISGISNAVGSQSPDPPLSLALKIYGPSNVYFASSHNSNFSENFKNLVKNEGSYTTDIKTLNQGNIIEALLAAANEDEDKYRQSMIIAGDFSENVPNVLYSSYAYHSPAIIINLLYNAFLKYSPPENTYSINSINHPYLVPDIETVGVILCWVFMSFGLAGLVGLVFIKSPHAERRSLLKHLEIMTGTSPITYWMSYFLWDILVYCFATALILGVLLSADTYNYLSAQEAGVLELIMVLFGISATWMAYCFSYLFKTSSNASNLFYTAYFMISLAALLLFNLAVNSYSFVKFILRLIPFSSFVYSLQLFGTKSLSKYECRLPSNPFKIANCEGILKESYFDEHLNYELYFLGFDWVLYLSIVILVELDVFNFLANHLMSYYVGSIDTPDPNSVEHDVSKERDRVDAALKSSDTEGAPLVIVDGLGKKFSRTFTAVHDVSFTSKAGECFGLLGVNGAGKTTTFSILSGLIPPTCGNTWINGYSLKENKSKCLSFIGYCPQFSSLGEALTGRQMLTLFANLRLIPPSKVNSLVNKWIYLLGLEEYCERPCGTYSGGNKRKLSTAMAFINDPAVILLDEPTSGVDPVTRRNLWTVIKECKNKNQTIVISSHSMDECEAVCDRLTIMARGNMQCIGNVQRLKSLYGQGFIILIKMKEHSDEEVVKLKERIDSDFGPKCSLKDEHMVLLHYHINDLNYKLSTVFSLMENVKSSFEIIDEYSISDSSLEHVFLSFAKKKDSN